MKTIIAFVTVLAFLFIVYRRKFASAFPGKKPGASAPPASMAALESAPHPEAGSFPPLHAKVFVFEYRECSPDAFSELAEAKLSIFLSQIEGKGRLAGFSAAPYRDALLVFVVYESL